MLQPTMSYNGVSHAGSSNSTTELWGDLPPLQWEDSPTDLANFAENFQSPHFVKLEPRVLTTEESAGSPVFNLGALVDVTKPFLAFSRRRRTKLYAENLVWDDKKRLYVPNGHIIEVPKDYLGWFEVLPQDKSSQAPEHYSTIAGLADSGTTHFLLCTLTAGFTGTMKEEGELQLQSETWMYPGEILKIEESISKNWKVMGETADACNRPQTKYLRCTDRKKKDIYIPYAHPGKFCALADTLTQETNVVYQVSSLSEMVFPQLVRLVFGWPPDNYPSFTGLMRLGGYNRVDTLVLYNLTEQRTIITELPLDLDVMLYKASNMEEVKASNTYQEIIEKCCANVFPYVTSLKALSVKYRRHIVEEEDVNQNEVDKGSKDKKREKTKSHSKSGRLASGMDMNTFSPLNVFPPREEDEQVTDTWSLSFKDPEYLYDEVGNVIDENAVWMDVTGGQQSRLLRVTNPAAAGASGDKKDHRASVSCDMGKSYTMLPHQPQDNMGMKGLPRIERRRDLRATRDRELKSREARC